MPIDDPGMMDQGESLQTSSAWKRVGEHSFLNLSWHQTLLESWPKPRFPGHTSRDSDFMGIGEKLHFLFLFFNIYLFIWLRWVLVAACRIFVAARGLQDSLFVVHRLSSGARA